MLRNRRKQNKINFIFTFREDSDEEDILADVRKMVPKQLHGKKSVLKSV